MEESFNFIGGRWHGNVEGLCESSSQDDFNKNRRCSLLSSMQTFKFKKKKSLQTINGFQSRDERAMLLHKTIANLVHVLHNNTIKFLKDFLLVYSVH